MTVTALAERYRDLGFRVIEGGKSNKLIVVNTVEMAENFRKDHFNVLRDIRSLRKRIETEPTASNLKASFHSDFRKTTYIDAKKERRECYELTETGFEALALGYDSILRYRYAIAFRELKEQLGEEARPFVQPVIDHMQELRGHQPELDFTPTAKTEQSELFEDEPHPSEIKPHPSEWSASYAKWREHTIETTLPRPLNVLDDDDADDTNARHQWAQHKPAMFMRDQLPIGHSADSWRVWVSEQWFRLPLDLRRRWWRDTNYGECAPSDGMIQAIIAIALP